MYVSIGQTVTSRGSLLALPEGTECTVTAVDNGFSGTNRIKVGGRATWHRVEHFILPEPPLVAPESSSAEDTRARIEHQQGVANRVLRVLQNLNPSTIVAGGAPRDWYMGKVAADIDVYIHYDLFAPSHVQSRLIRELDGEWETLGSNDVAFEHDYARLTDMLSVYQGRVDGEIVQVIVMREPTWGLVDKFPISSSMAWYKEREGVMTSPHFLKFISEKIQVVSDEYHEQLNTNRYMIKMLERFPRTEYTYIKRSDYVSYMSVTNAIDAQRRRTVEGRNIWTGISNGDAIRNVSLDNIPNVARFASSFGGSTTEVNHALRSTNNGINNLEWVNSHSNSSRITGLTGRVVSVDEAESEGPFNSEGESLSEIRPRNTFVSQYPHGWTLSAGQSIDVDLPMPAMPDTHPDVRPFL